jgi:hypothetical protein
MDQTIFARSKKEEMRCPVKDYLRTFLHAFFVIFLVGQLDASAPGLYPVETVVAIASIS